MLMAEQPLSILLALAKLQTIVAGHVSIEIVGVGGPHIFGLLTSEFLLVRCIARRGKTGLDTGPAKLKHGADGDVAGRGEEEADDHAEADGGLADGTFRFAAVCECRASFLCIICSGEEGVGVSLGLCIIFFSLTDAITIPHGDGDRGGEPKKTEEEIDGGVGVDVV